MTTSRRQIEQHHRDQPEDDVRGALLCRHTYPRQADDEEDLREDEIGETQFLLQERAMSFDCGFFSPKLCSCRRVRHRT